MKKKLMLSILIVVLVLLVVLDLTQGSTNGQVLSILIPQFRIPRLFAVIIAAIALSLAGFIIQSTVDNPLADSSTLGITSGASAGAVLALFIGHQFNLTGNWIFSYPLFALLGAGLAFLVLYQLAIKKNYSNFRILLSGLAITALFQSLITIAQLSINSFDLNQVAIWLSGDVWQTDLGYVSLNFVFLIVGIILLSFCIKRMETLALGSQVASSLGLDVEKTKIGLYLLALFFASIGVLLVGGLAFIGLIAPHIAREIVGFSYRKRMWVTMLVSVNILILADFLSQIIIAPSSLPIGFV
ncbi:MAG: iron ABC transporter permease, partial [Streptococcaceae bacterium]|nr:iron ABC transporter permease [Streptococcaceae bacterium]